MPSTIQASRAPVRASKTQIPGNATMSSQGFIAGQDGFHVRGHGAGELPFSVQDDSREKVHVPS
jgi:hypothetical protein